jgi:hypothetical protein
MVRNGREVVPDFDTSERLYIRYSAVHFVEGQLEPAAIRSSLKQSANRELFSEPEDALFSEEGQYNGLGIVEIAVGNIPAEQDQETGPTYEFFAVHEPEDLNYSHSEIWSDHKPRNGCYRKPSKTVSLRFRIRLCQLITTSSIRILAVR